MFPKSPLVRIVGLVIALTALLVGVGVFFLRGATPETPELPAPELEEETAGVVIGNSVEGRPITAHTYGTGDTTLVFVGGIHGGYEWNSVLLAYELMDYLEEDSSRIPANLSVVVIPDANPDGTYRVIGKEGRFTVTDVPAGDHSSGRFNANGVDLNRNFACKWQAEATWRGNKVSAGTNTFSEPEAQALRDFFIKEKPVASVFFHSQANAVYASECEAGILPETLSVMSTYANAAGYNAVSSFTAYPVTGDIEGWLASIGIPAVTVELSSHTAIEWERNLRGITALFTLYSKKLAPTP